MKLRKLVAIGIIASVSSASLWADEPVSYVNPFIGTTNFGTTNPGAICPNGLMSVSPFNVMGSDTNVYDKDARWWSTPYEFHNKFFTGFSHVNLSGVGCPDLGSLLLMPTAGELKVDYKEYGSPYSQEQAHPGYYANHLDRYGITTEVSATTRSSIARFTYPGGEGHILLNLGEGLTNESGATIRKVSDTEYEGSKLLGGFCYYNRQGVFPIYFVIRVDKAPAKAGYWKKQRPMVGVEAEWDPDNGKHKIYSHYNRVMSGDDIGLFLSYDTKPGEQIQVQIGVSFVSTENARENLNKEQTGFQFDQVSADARKAWNEALSRVEVEGGTADQKTIFYTALYHMLIHPNILQDVNGQYPAMESNEILTTTHNRYTVFSLWDTFRNVHPFFTLAYPEMQLNMVESLIDMYKEWGWLPRWELYGNETRTMSGDPATIMIADTYMRGLTGFDTKAAYEAMTKSARSTEANNPMRDGGSDYLKLGYVPLREQYDNSVSQALEYYLADFALSQFANALGHKADAKEFAKRSLGYKNYYCKEFGTLRPMLEDGSFYSPFNPLQGANFEPTPGLLEGNAWNYTFYIPHDIQGLKKLMGGERKFTDKLSSVFDNKFYDPANEPDITYPYLFAQVKGQEWKTDSLVHELLAEHFQNQPKGIPGNDDTGTMSAWAVFSMMGFYPDCPGLPRYTLVAPVFDKITLHLDSRYYEQEKLVIEVDRATPIASYIDYTIVGGKKQKSRFISHDELSQAGCIKFKLK